MVSENSAAAKIQQKTRSLRAASLKRHRYNRHRVEDEALVAFETGLTGSGNLEEAASRAKEILETGGVHHHDEIMDILDEWVEIELQLRAPLRWPLSNL